MQERPTGGKFRFQVAPSGLITFATADRTFDSAEAVPVQYRRAAGLIHERLNRNAVQAAIDTPDDVTFCGVATRNERVSYDWNALPAFVGTDVWSETKGAFLPPDAATTVFDRVGLPTLPAIEKETPVSHTDFTRFEDPDAFPPSHWRDGTAACVVIRDKAGGRMAAWRVDPSTELPTTTQRSPTDVANAYATTDRIERTIATLRDSDNPLTVDAICDRLVADVAREAYAELFSDEEFAVSHDEFRSAVAERIQQHQFAG